MHLVSSSRLGRLALGLFAGSAVLLALAAWWPVSDAHGLPPEFAEACDGDNPYLVTVCYRRARSAGVAAREPAVIAFRDTPGDAPHHLLATYGQVGSVYGLAFSERESALYASAFHKRQMPFGPGGPGAIYRLDVTGGDVAHVITVPDAGPDRHEPRYGGPDRSAEPYAGKTSLGDLDLSSDGTELFVVNLDNRRIYRFAMPSGTLLGSFAHGASAEPWATEARPFGLAVRDGLVYHAVVRSAEDTSQASDLELRIYVSAPDGSNMRQVAESTLDYARGTLTPYNPRYGGVSIEWRPWTDRPGNLLPPSDWRPAFIHPMPVASDIVFDPAGSMVVGLRDRVLDMATTYLQGDGREEKHGFGAGDILAGTAQGDKWRFVTLPEHFDDNAVFSDEATLGGLASLDRANAVAANAWGEIVDRPAISRERAAAPSVLWFDADGGGKRRHEAVCRTYGAQPRLALGGARRAWADDEYLGYAGSTGDLEVLCGEHASPTHTATVTAAPTSRPSATASPRPSSSPTASAEPSPTNTAAPTATEVPSPLYLPVALRESCDPEHRRSDIALVLDTSSSMTGQKIADAKSAALLFVGMIDLEPGRSQVAIVRYDREADVVRELTRSRALIEAAIRSLQVRSGTHIDKGLRAALGELQSPRHVGRNLPVTILLTDGLQTGTPGEELRAAQEVRDAGVRLYTIGLGSDVDETALKAMAGDEARYFPAPDSTDLARIYAEIGQDLTCPGKELWGGR